MDIYEYFKAQGVKIESPPEMFTGDNSCYLYQGREGEEPILVIAPHQGRIPSQLWLTVQRKLSQNTTFQNGRKCHNTWLAGENQVWALWLCANCLESSKRRCLPTMQTAGGQRELRGCRYADRKAKHGGVCLRRDG